MRGLDIAGEVGLGAAQGYGELAWDATRELLLTWVTGGFYQAIQGYHFYSALYAGYDEKGWLGALSVLNPLAGILTPAENATHEAVKGDYRAAGREGIKSLIAVAITVVTVAIVPKPSTTGAQGNTGPGVAAPKGGANTATSRAAARGSRLHADKPGHLPDQLRARYPDTQFEFAKPGKAGQDVRVTGGKHPSEYPGSTWPKGVNHGDFKPGTPSGSRTFARDQANKWSETTHRLPYDPSTGNLQ
jgi:hypothetical protein